MSTTKTRETKYVIKSKLGGNYVETFAFNVNGVAITYTGDMSKAARVSMREIAEHLAACSMGKAVKA